MVVADEINCSLDLSDYHVHNNNLDTVDTHRLTLTCRCLNLKFYPTCIYLIIILKGKCLRSGFTEIVAKKYICFNISHRGVWILLATSVRAQVCLSGSTKMFYGFSDIFSDSMVLPYSSASMSTKRNGKCTFK